MPPQRISTGAVAKYILTSGVAVRAASSDTDGNRDATVADVTCASSGDSVSTASWCVYRGPCGRRGTTNNNEAQVQVHTRGMRQGVHDERTPGAAPADPYGREELPMPVPGVHKPILAAGQHDAALPDAPVIEVATERECGNAAQGGVCRADGGYLPGVAERDHGGK